MICSANEIEAALRKAAVGAGYPTGLAISMAEAGLWLCRHGADGLNAVLATTHGGAACAGFTLEISGHTHTIRCAVAGLCGPSVFEMLVTGQAERIVLDGVDSPTLLAGFAGTIGAATGSSFEFSSDPHQAAPTTRIEIRWSPTPRYDPPVTRHGIEVDPAMWAAVNELAARTYVPATDESRRQGAGAGLTDND